MIILLISVLLSASCLVASEQYSYKAYHGQSPKLNHKQDQLAFLKEKMNLNQLELVEVGVELSGIVYNEKLQGADIENKKEQMKRLLEKNEEKDGYTFSVKNQEDIHYNTYYNLKIVGSSDTVSMDQLRNQAYAQLEAWQVIPKETTYFKAILKGEALDQEEGSKIKEALFKGLKAKSTNFYQDDRVTTTYAYYGYTPYIEDYIVEADGKKSNMQIIFKYNELLSQTELIIAFPFYNEPF